MAGDAGIKRYFASTGAKTSSSKKPKVEQDPVVDLTHEDEIDLTKSDEEGQSRQHAAQVSSKSRVSPQKGANNPPPRSRGNVAATSASAGGSTGTPTDAKAILARIPDAQLPEIDPNAPKPNFWAMDRQNHEAPQAGTSNASSLYEAAPNCLAGLTFVVTGQLPTLAREEVQDTIKRYGGHVTSSISGRTSALVLGADAGPSKITKAKQLGLKVIDEDGFRQLLQDMPANGGSGEAAQRAMQKQAKQEAEIREQAERLKGSPAPSGNKPKSEDGRHIIQSTHIPSNGDLWTTKYAPKQLSDMCGNQAAVNRLRAWLANWAAARKRHFTKTPGIDGSEFRAAMLHGPPGIGKTTAAHLIGHMLGFDVIEYNASDTRSKSLLNQDVARTLKNVSLFSGSKGEKPILVVMDEVDGMSAGDRGGVGAMAAFARTTNVPLVLICNERSLPKMRPFDRVTFDIPFRRPDAVAIRQRLMAIAAAEGLKMDSAAVEQLAAQTRSDIRQMINLIAAYATTQTSMSYDSSRQFSKTWNKEVVLKPFDIVARFLSKTPMSLMDKIELYFNDYDLAPLMVEENYLQTAPQLEAAAQAAESISDSDMVDRLIHGSQQMWSLMPLHAIESCVIPSAYAGGHSRGRFNFPAFLGNLSKGNKYRRLVAELRSHMRLRTAATTRDLRLEYHPLLVKRLLGPILARGDAGIEPVIDFMDQYYLTREDWDVVMELGVGPQAAEKAAKTIPTPVKTAFTRNYNKASHPTTYMRAVDSKAAATSGKKGPKPDIDDVVEDDMDAAEPDAAEPLTLEEELANDKYIKRPTKRGASAKGATKSTAKGGAKPTTRKPRAAKK